MATPYGRRFWQPFVPQTWLADTEESSQQRAEQYRPWANLSPTGLLGPGGFLSPGKMFGLAYPEVNETPENQLPANAQWFRPSPQPLGVPGFGGGPGGYGVAGSPVFSQPPSYKPGMTARAAAIPTMPPRAGTASPGGVLSQPRPAAPSSAQTQQDVDPYLQQLAGQPQASQAPAAASPDQAGNSYESEMARRRAMAAWNRANQYWTARALQTQQAQGVRPGVGTTALAQQWGAERALGSNPFSNRLRQYQDALAGEEYTQSGPGWWLPGGMTGQSPWDQQREGVSPSIGPMFPAPQPQPQPQARPAQQAMTSRPAIDARQAMMQALSPAPMPTLAGQPSLGAVGVANPFFADPWQQEQAQPDPAAPRNNLRYGRNNRMPSLGGPFYFPTL